MAVRGKPFKKGEAPGRPHGAVNKATQANREAFQLLVDRNFDKLESWVNEVAANDPHKAFGMVMDLASFCVPRLKSIEVTGPDGQAISVTVNVPPLPNGGPEQ
jgi:hypothetical protein